jgi:hypothetical protein
LTPASNFINDFVETTKTKARTLPSPRSANEVMRDHKIKTSRTRWVKTLGLFLLIPGYWHVSMSCSGFGGGAGGGGGGPLPLGDTTGGLPPGINGLGSGDGSTSGGPGGGDAQPSWQKPDGGIMRPSMIKYVGTVCYRPSEDADCTTTFNATTTVSGWQKDQSDPTAQWVASTLGLGGVNLTTGNFTYVYNRRNLPPNPTWFKISFFYADNLGCYSGETPEVTLNTPENVLKPALELKRTTGKECLWRESPVANPAIEENKVKIEE